MTRNLRAYRVAGFIFCLLALPALGQERSVSQRIEDRSFPSIFQAWNGAENLPDEDPAATIARHDVYFHGPGAFGLVWEGGNVATARGFTADSIERALDYRRKLLTLNPDLILLAEVRYRGAHREYLPGPRHPWWMKDGAGNPVPSWADGPEDRQLTFQNADTWRLALTDEGFQASVAAKAAALMSSGVVDGVMLDWWDERDFPDARLSLIQKIRSAIGDGALIVVNTNHRRIPLSAPFINGVYMETGYDHSPEAWNGNLEVMQWAEGNLRKPSLVLYESWYRNSRADLAMMRANATLSSIVVDGYALFTEPNTVVGPDHRHDWYDFWNADLGSPEAPGARRSDGAYERWFSNGMALYNPPDNGGVTVRFERPVRSVATGRCARSHEVDAFDGDFFLPMSSAPALIRAFAAPESIEAGGSLTVRVPFAVMCEADLLLVLQDTSDGWATYGLARSPVAAGDGDIDVRLSVDAGAPAGAQYALTAYLVPPGGEWNQRLASRTVGGIDVR